MMNPPPRFSHHRRAVVRAFTLVEILVAMVVLLLLLGMIFSVTTTTGRTVSKASAAIDAFTAGRATFDLVAQRLSQASLNTYYDYFDVGGNPLTAANSATFAPHHYGRQSNLQFLVATNPQASRYGHAVYFVSPQAYSNRTNQLATQGLLNACAFYVQYGSDDSFRPSYGGTGGSGGVLTQGTHYRYRLMQALEPTESLEVFFSVANNDMNWITNLTYNLSSKTSGQYVAPLADNVIALLVWPRLSEEDDPAGTVLAKNYLYNSRPTAISATQAATDNQLPPNVYVTMVTISDAAARRLDTHSTSAPSLIEDALLGKFTDVTKYQDELNQLSSTLAASKIDYRIFTTSVTMRDSRWSSIQ